MNSYSLHKLEVYILIFAAFLSTPLSSLAHAAALTAEIHAQEKAFAATVTCPVVDCQPLEAYVTELEGYKREIVDWIKWATNAKGAWEAVKSSAVSLYEYLRDVTAPIRRIVSDFMNAVRGTIFLSWVASLLSYLRVVFAPQIAAVVSALTVAAAAALALISEYIAWIIAVPLAVYGLFLFGLVKDLAKIEIELAVAKKLLQDCKDLQAKQIAECYAKAAASGIDEQDVVIAYTQNYAFTRIQYTLRTLQDMVITPVVARITQFLNAVRTEYNRLLGLASQVSSLISRINAILQRFRMPLLPQLSLPSFNLPTLLPPGPLRR